MLQWCRRQSRALAGSLLVCLAVLGAWSALAHGNDCHDADCVEAFIVHDASAHVLDAPQAAVGGNSNHCILCHSVRTLRPLAPSTHVLAAAASQDVRPQIADVRAASGALAVQPPLRSPPLSATV